MTIRMRPVVGLLLLIVTACGGRGDRGAGVRDEALSDVLTLEGTFGAEDIAEEYILARPSPEGVGVDIEGNVLVVDEAYVKVFGADGRPMQLLGGSGEGPGEFARPRIIWMGADGYFTVLDGWTAHHFRPDHSFLDRTDLMFLDSFRNIMEVDNLLPQEPEAVYCLGELERVYALDSRDVDRENRSRKEIYLFYQDADSLQVIAHYPQSNFVSSPLGNTVSSGVWGSLEIAPLPGKRIVYLHTHHDTEISEAGVTYRLTLLDLKTMRSTHIDHHDPAYLPVECSWEPMSYPEEYREQQPEQWRRMQVMNQLVEEFIAERKFDCPVQRLYTDDEFIFVFTNARNDSSDVKVDVFRADRGYLRSAWFSVGFGCICDGYLYKVSNYFSGEEFPQIEKYRIDPRVYGRR